MTTLLVADDEQIFLDFIVRLLQKQHNLLVARNWNEVLEKYQANVWKLNATILDVNMPGLSVDPYTIVDKLLKLNPTVPIIVISGQDLVLRQEFLKMGVFQYHGKPIDIVDLNLSIRNALEHNRLLRQLEHFAKQTEEKTRYYGKLLNLDTAELSERISGYDTPAKKAPILIRGEAGCRPLMLASVVNREVDGGLFFRKVCNGALKNIIPHNLQNGDTLYLEGIEYLGEEEISSLNQLINEHRNGAKEEASFRIIVSISNQVNGENGRQQLSRLLEQIGGAEFRIEPLRLRKHELRDVIKAVFEQKKKEHFTRSESISDELYQMLIEYDWPLNYEELELVIECLLLTCQEPVLSLKHLHHLNFSDMACSEYPTLHDMVDEHIKKALRLTMGNKSRAARMLGITPKTLYARIRN